MTDDENLFFPATMGMTGEKTVYEQALVKRGGDDRMGGDSEWEAGGEEAGFLSSC